jgi:penicillin-binding protein activator
MNMRQCFIGAIPLVCLFMSIAGCESMPSMPTKIFGGSEGQQGDVEVVDPRDRSHLQAELHSGDYLTLAENVTNKMLSSRLVQGWGSKRPRLIVGILVNNTDNENIRMVDLQDRIQEVIFNSGLVRVVDKSATSFDYIIKSELTSSRQYGSGNQEQVFYTLQLKMFKLDGELMGQWSDDMSLAKAKKSWL